MLIESTPMPDAKMDASGVCSTHPGQKLIQRARKRSATTAVPIPKPLNYGLAVSVDRHAREIDCSRSGEPVSATIWETH